LSGGQRKLMFFELIRQRTAEMEDLLIVLGKSSLIQNFLLCLIVSDQYLTLCPLCTQTSPT
jgi:hypothetical protein